MEEVDQSILRRRYSMSKIMIIYYYLKGLVDLRTRVSLQKNTSWL